MEKEGLVRAVQFFRKKRFKIATLVTDRHRQIAKWARETSSLQTIAMTTGMWQNVCCKYINIIPLHINNLLYCC